MPGRPGAPYASFGGIVSLRWPPFFIPTRPSSQPLMTLPRPSTNLMGFPPGLRELSNCVPFRAGDFGFTVDCVAQCENILSIDQAQLDLAVGPMGILDDAALQNVIKAIGYVIDSDCEPT